MNHGRIANGPDIGIRRPVCVEYVEMIVGYKTANQIWFSGFFFIRGKGSHLFVFSSLTSSAMEEMSGFGASPVLQTSRPNLTVIYVFESSSHEGRKGKYSAHLRLVL